MRFKLWDATTQNQCLDIARFAVSIPRFATIIVGKISQYQYESPTD